MSKWIHTTLNDICRSDKGAIISGPFGSNISSKFFVLDGVPVIRGNNLSLSLDKFYDDDFVFVTEEKADELNCYAEEGDLIFTAAGTIGQVGILEAPLKYKKYVISNKQLRARIDTRKVDLLYAYYWFASAWMQNYFIRNNKGSTVPLITLSELKDAPISYPEDITEQKKIAMAIEAISRKMDELNQDKVKQLKDACHRMMVEGDFVKYENVYHGVLTECSSQSTGIQLADYAVGIMNCYLRKHLMSRGDYTFATDLYTEFVLPHLRKHANGTIVGYGVREVPSDSSIRQVLIPLFN